MLIPVFTNAQAVERLCPFNVVKGCCVANDCMAWTITERYTSREDHSGANMLMVDEQARRAPGSEIKRKGPPGSTGTLYLEERGYCRRLWNSLTVIR